MSGMSAGESAVESPRIHRLLATYPRNRPALSPQWQRLYTVIYKEGRDGETFLYRLTQMLESWMHRKVATRGDGLRVLELGAGTLNHVGYETAAASYDVVEPFRELYEGRQPARAIGRYYGDIGEIEAGRSYDRIVSIATLEHIADLPAAVARAALLLAPGGSFHAGIPSEGGFLWGASWRGTVGLSCRLRHGLDYGELMRHEHLSDAEEIIEIVKYLFAKCTVQRFPLPLHHLSLYAALAASDPILERCRRLAGVRPS